MAGGSQAGGEVGADGAAGAASVISGAYQLWHAPLHPLFAELPGWFALTAPEMPRLSPLALETGLSRTALAVKFRDAMGETPLAHLRTLRMQKALQLLGEPRRKLDEVARAVGVSPGEFRERDAAERASPWRLGGSATGT